LEQFTVLIPAEDDCRGGRRSGGGRLSGWEEKVILIINKVYVYLYAIQFNSIFIMQVNSQEQYRSIRKHKRKPKAKNN